MKFKEKLILEYLYIKCKTSGINNAPSISVTGRDAMIQETEKLLKTLGKYQSGKQA